MEVPTLILLLVNWWFKCPYSIILMEIRTVLTLSEGIIITIFVLSDEGSYSLHMTAKQLALRYTFYTDFESGIERRFFKPLLDISWIHNDYKS